MAYGLLGLLISLGLLAVLLLHREAGYRVKVLATVGTLIALWLRYRMADATILGILLQAAVGIGVALYLRYLGATRGG